MSEAFGFNINKPQGTVGISGKILSDLQTKYPQSDPASTDEDGYLNIIAKLFPEQQQIGKLLLIELFKKNLVIEFLLPLLETGTSKESEMA